jgi:hypothetical protein
MTRSGIDKGALAPGDILIQALDAPAATLSSVG